MYANVKQDSKKSKLYYAFKYMSVVFCVFENPENKHVCIIYYIFYWFVVIAIQLQGIWHRILLSKFIVLSVTIIEMVLRGLLLLANFFTSLDILFFKTQKICEINLIISRFENSNSKFQTELTRSRQRFLIFSTLILGSIGLTAMFNFFENRGSKGLLSSNAFAPLIILVIQTTMLITSMCLKLRDIGTCLKILNREMYQTITHSYTWVIMGNTSARRQQFFGFIQIYNDFFKALDLADNVYSFHFLLLLLSATLAVLHISNLLVKYIAGILPVYGNIWKLTSIVILVITYMIFGILLTYVCDDVVKQEKDTLEVTYKLLLKLPGELKVEEEKYIKEYLMLFAEEIHGRNFHFTAGGLFPVDLTALFMMLGSIAMYLIIIPVEF